MGLALTAGGIAGVAWTWEAARTDGLDPGDMAGVLSFGVTAALGLAALAQGWVSYRADRRESAEGVQLTGLADTLRTVVRRQWEAEAQVRLLYGPYPLAVSWHQASPDLVEEWPILKTVATRWPGSTDGAGWASGPAGLAGSGNEIAEVYSERIPTRRLVVLGQPGAGKTVLLIRLLLDLLKQPGSEAIPILFSLAGWNPAEEDLYTWMAQRMARDYAGLGAAAPTMYESSNRARALLDAGLILPILDGFDEIPAALRPPALDAINQELPPGQGLILASRLAEFRDASARDSGAPVKLAGAAGIELRPVRPVDAAEYLRDTAEGPQSAPRWDPVITSLGTRAPVARALRTPLMLFLARTIYNPRPGERPTSLPEPAELCDTERLPTKTDVENHLFDAYIPAAYRPHRRYPCRWTPQKAESALVHLARHQQRNLHGASDLAWWQLNHALPQRAIPMLTALPIGVAFGLQAWLWLGPMYGFGIAAISTLGNERIFRHMGEIREPASRLRWSLRLGELTSGIASGVAIWLVAHHLVAAFAGGIAIALALGFSPKPADLNTVVGPAALLLRDRRTAILPMIIYALSTCLLLGAGPLIFTALSGVSLVVGPYLSVLSLAPGAIPGAWLAFNRSAWGKFTIARIYLALRKRLPIRLMAFLADAHERRGVLRQVGGVYQFRHIDLQHRLASRS
ncbi:NACHT domain-containing protein [Streptomyces sp. NPDC127197]|uniref:NACHT domain-containing protein n=1 Tax=Streptomyces sp. NPDC127197 TaxID=3345388 RepID=UPI00362A5CA8